MHHQMILNGPVFQAISHGWRRRRWPALDQAIGAL
jgi:hypothetical protein